jgi:hypothetical protein
VGPPLDDQFNINPNRIAYLDRWKRCIRDKKNETFGHFVSLVDDFDNQLKFVYEINNATDKSFYVLLFWYFDPPNGQADQQDLEDCMRRLNSFLQVEEIHLFYYGQFNDLPRWKTNYKKLKSVEVIKEDLPSFRQLLKTVCNKVCESMKNCLVQKRQAACDMLDHRLYEVYGNKMKEIEIIQRNNTNDKVIEVESELKILRDNRSASDRNVAQLEQQSHLHENRPPTKVTQPDIPNQRN